MNNLFAVSLKYNLNTHKEERLEDVQCHFVVNFTLINITVDQQASEIRITQRLRKKSC